jgi:hypothetical protein
MLKIYAQKKMLQAVCLILSLTVPTAHLAAIGSADRHLSED